MNFRSCVSHGAADVFDLQPGALEVPRSLLFGNNADSSGGHHPGNKLVRVNQRATNGYKQDAWANLTRIVRDICYENILTAS